MANHIYQGPPSYRRKRPLGAGFESISVGRRADYPAHRTDSPLDRAKIA